MNTDVAIIGAGAAGILCAYALKEYNLDVVLLDSKKICSGVTLKTTGKITSQHGLIYYKLRKAFGDELASLYAKSNEDAIRMYDDIISKEKIQCDFKKVKSYLYTTDYKRINEIEEEVITSELYKIRSSFVDKIELPFNIKAGVAFENQAQINPTKFFNKIIKVLSLKNNYHIYENSKVIKIEDNIVFTELSKIKAKYIIVCTHFPIINDYGSYFLKMYQDRSYILGLDVKDALQGMYLSIDEDGFSFRDYHTGISNVLLFGGMHHKTGHNKPGRNFEELALSASELYPNSKVNYRWSNQDSMPLDDIPYIGLYSPETPNMFVATGFKKWGMTLSMVASKIIEDLIMKKESQYASLYDPNRVKLSQSIRNFTQSTGDTLKNLIKKQFVIPKTKFEDLPISHGGIVEYENEKIGVYKDESGEIYAVRPICPHLGCLVQWNPDEKTWDCPCHGSRFDKEGKVIDSPTIKDLDKIELI